MHRVALSPTSTYHCNNEQTETSERSSKEEPRSDGGPTSIEEKMTAPTLSIRLSDTLALVPFLSMWCDGTATVMQMILPSLPTTCYRTSSTPIGVDSTNAGIGRPNRDAS